MMEWLSAVFTGQTLAYCGIALAVACCCAGSAKGLGIVGEAGAGLLTEDPARFAQILILQILPSTNGIYGFVIGMLVMVQLGMFGGNMVALDFGQGALVLATCIPIAAVGYIAAIAQSRVCAGAVSIISKRPEELAKGILLAVMIEFFTIVALLVSILLLMYLPF
jgi:V/A-type H+-transporting ATPase subunit K